MAKKPSKRYQSAGDLAAAARAALAVPVRTTGRSGRHSAQRVSTRARISKKVAAIAGATVVVLALCAVGVWQLRGGAGAAQNPNPADTASKSGAVQAQMGPVDKIAKTVPAKIRESGRLVIGVNVPYAPNEFKNSSGEIVGFDVDLAKAVARTLGLVPEFRESGFEAILPAVQDGNLNVGMSSITDTRERQQKVDFVTYFQAGTLWAQRTGSSADPNAACGLRVGVKHGTVQQTEEIPAKSAVCVAAGLPPIEEVVRPQQDEVTAALIAGEVDAMSADSPVAGFAIKLSGGALQPAGEVFDSAPYGWPVAKGSGLAESLRLALEHLMDTGEYRTIATMWGVEKGMITQPVINGALR
jgi:ABC-type amino acid transport substrate-binding protein